MCLTLLLTACSLFNWVVCNDDRSLQKQAHKVPASDASCINKHAASLGVGGMGCNKETARATHPITNLPLKYNSLRTNQRFPNSSSSSSSPSSSIPPAPVRGRGRGRFYAYSTTGFAISRSFVLRIFPVGFRGSDGSNSSRRGTL